MKIAVAGGTGTVGRYVVEAGRAAGHDMVVLSRARGTDLRNPDGDQALARALEGTEVIVDTTNPHTLSRQAATAFFEEVSGRLQRVGASRGVRRLVTLSIVGVDRVPSFGYYQAKQRHEAASFTGPLLATVVRATQFHEFAAQILRMTQRGPIAAMAVMRIQPIAARTVGQYLIDTATSAQPRDGQVLEIAGPEPAELVTLARSYLRRRGYRALVIPIPVPGATGRAMRHGALLPTDGVPRLGPRFTDWLDSPDAAMASF